MERGEQSKHHPLDDEEKGCGGRETSATSGKQAGQYVDKHALSVCKEPKGKCENKPSINIRLGHQNAGKW